MTTPFVAALIALSVATVTTPQLTRPVLAPVLTGGVFTKVVDQIRLKSYAGLGGLVHADGFSVYYSPTSPEVVFSRNQLLKMAIPDDSKLDFGVSPGSGMPITVTAQDFFFGSRDSVAKGVGPLPDWAKITQSTSTKAYKKAQVTSWETATHIPTKFARKPFWSMAYKDDSNRFDTGEVRVVFDIDDSVTETNKYRVVAIVLAAPYSP